MCKICDHIANTRSPFQITAAWTANQRSSTITTDLSKCEIGFYNEETDKYEMVEWKVCPVCGKQLKIEPCTTMEDIVKREG